MAEKSFVNELTDTDGVDEEPLDVVVFDDEEDLELLPHAASTVASTTTPTKVGRT